jgi:hypothetical protein
MTLDHSHSPCGSKTELLEVIHALCTAFTEFCFSEDKYGDAEEVVSKAPLWIFVATLCRFLAVFLNEGCDKDFDEGLERTL